MDGYRVKRGKNSKKKEERAARAAEKAARTDIGLSIATHRAMILLALLTLLFKSLIFAPISWWPLAFVCLVPWLVMIVASPSAPRVYLYSFLLGAVYYVISVRWMYMATGAGYVLLAFYLAVYFPFIACSVRSVVRRRRWPLALAFPFVWVGCEVLRAVVISGFPWFFLSHSLSGVLTLIQISDLVGAYGVSFVVAAINGAVADVVIAWWVSRGKHPSRRLPRPVWFGVAFAGCLLIATITYGRVRLGQDTTTSGPKIAILQGDFVSSVHREPFTDAEKKRIYFEMMEAAASEEPDLYLLPESPWRLILNPVNRDYHPLSRESFSDFTRHAMNHHAYIVTGCARVIDTPNDLLATRRVYNSSAVFYPDGSEPGRYDKVHLVPFGEFVPFRFGRLRPLYFWLNSLMPFSGPDGTFEYSTSHGDGFHRFSMNPTSMPGETYRFGIPICYEDVMPYVSREFVAGDPQEKGVDFLLNISNDGWFSGTQQPQHLAICVFRAVENRVGFARAVNTGVSAFIDPNGFVHDVVRGDPATPWPGVAGYAVANVLVDSRYSLYSKYGDWFAWLCALVWGIFFVDYWMIRARERRKSDQESVPTRERKTQP